MTMTEYVFTPDLPVTLPVAGSQQRFPLAGYFASAATTLGQTPKASPASRRCSS